MTETGWLLVGIVLGVVLTVALAEWYAHHLRRMAHRRSRTGDEP